MTWYGSTMQRLRPFLEPRILQYMAFRIFGMGMAYGVALLLARWLGPAGFGSYSLAVMAIALVAVPFGRGWSTLVLRNAAAEGKKFIGGTTRRLISDGRLLSAAYVSVIGIGAAVSVAQGVFAWLPALLVLLAILTKQNSAFRLSLLRGKGFVKLNQVPEQIVQPAVLTLLLGFIVLAGGVELTWQIGLACFVAGLVTSYILGLALQRRVFRDMPWEPPAQESAITKANLSNAAVIGANGLMIALAAQLDTYILGLFTDTAEVGVYRFAVQFALLGSFVYSSLNYLAANEVAELWAKGDRQQIQVLSRRYALLSVAACLAFAAGLAVLGDWFIEVTVGATYGAARDLVLILMIGQTVAAAVGITGTILTMSGNERSFMRATIYGLVASAVVSIAAIPVAGAVGAALANVIGITVTNVFCLYRAITRVGVNASIFGRFNQT